MGEPMEMKDMRGRPSPVDEHAREQQQHYNGVGSTGANGFARTNGSGSHMVHMQQAHAAFRTHPGHGDFGGFDNDAIDFRNLEDYINGDDDNTMYFPESLVGNEVKNNDAPNVTNGSGGLGGTKNTGHQQHQAGQLLYGVLPPTNSAITYKNNLMNSGYSGHMHNLPESPPDSGSEPPYSPPDEDQKLHPIPPVHLSVSMNNNRKQPPLTQTQPLLSYSNTQPLKHMPDGGSVMGLGPQSHIPLIQQLPNLGVPSTPSGHPPSHHQHPPPPHLLHHNHMNQPQVNPLLPIPQGQPLEVVVNSPLGTPNLFNSLVRAPPYPTNKKRKHSESPNSNISSNSNGDLINGIMHIKQEPTVTGGSPIGNGLALPPANEIQRQHCSSPDHGSNHSANGQLLDDDMSFDFNGDSNMPFVDSSYQCIRFQTFQQTAWHVVCDANLKELPVPNYRVDADKGFNFSNADDAFVCQKKNHFQVTVHAQLAGDPHYVRTPEGLKKIDSFYIHFYGVKVESPSQCIKVEQSQSDRSKKPFHPVHVELGNDQMVKITVGRLHFSETTSNNMRKKGKPNPDQRYFYLVVGLHAHCGENNYPLVSSASERIIVRASNPGQFESEVELSWQKGLTADSIYHSGRVGVNTERPDESLVVHGNLKLTGHIVQPSDVRAKEDIQELDTKEQLRNLQQLRIVRYQYREDFAKHAGLHKDERQDTGIIAQEVQKVIPDAVKESGDIVLPSGQRIDNFLVVNKERIFMENIGAVKELCKVTDNLENRIDELERMNSKLAKLKRIDSLKSTSSGSTVTSLPSSSSIKKPLRRTGARRSAAKEGLCSNKFVQGTIIVLILVMAMCLIAMATLYILEWQKRQIYDLPATTTSSPNHSTSLSNNSAANGNYSSGSPTSLGVLQVTPPSVRTKTSTVIHATSSSYTVRVLGKRDPIGVPSNCVGNKTQMENCHSFCCSDLPSVDGQSRPTSSPVSRHRSSSTRIVATPTSTITTPTTTGQQWHEVAIPRMITSDDVTRVSSVVITPSSFQRAQPNSNILYEQQRGTIRSYEVEHSTEENYASEISGNKYPEENDAVPWVNRPNKGVNFVKIKNANNDKPSRQKRNLPNKDTGLATIVQSIRLIEFNHTISEEYCSNCREGNFTYRIPISKYMPQQPLTLEFTLSNGSGIFVDYCQTGNKITECSLMLNQGSNDSTLSIGPTNERKTEEATPAWVLPIGNFVESSYKFRITKIQTHLDEAMSPCEPQMKNKAWKLCREFLSGAWKKVSSEEIVVQRFSGGLSNFLYYCALPNSSPPLADEPSEVLLRIYGQMHDSDGVEMLITQSVIFTLLSERCLGPKLYGVFPEGRIEEYIPARPLLTLELTDSVISESIAGKLAKIHSLQVPINKEPTWLADTMSRWLQQIRKKVNIGSAKPEDQDKARKLLSYPLEKEYDWIMNSIPKTNSPVVFCHNDLQEGNILVHNNTPLSDDWLLFIDYEYCSYNYRGFDFGNHFCEWCYDYTNPDPPYFYTNMNNFPNREQQLNYIRAYLRYYSSDNNCGKTGQHNSIMKTEEKILKEANYFALVSDFFWGLWAIVNGTNNEIQFGYWDYSQARFDSYFKGKARILASDSMKKKSVDSE